MIVQTFKSKKPLPTVHFNKPPWPGHTYGVPANSSSIDPRPNDQDRKRAAQFKIKPEEFVRRDKVVRQLYIDCPWRPGELLRPAADNYFEQYGNVLVRGIYKSYHDFSTAEAMQWPADDEPYILSVQPQKGDSSLLCVTSDFLAKIPVGDKC